MYRRKQKSKKSYSPTSVFLAIAGALILGGLIFWAIKTPPENSPVDSSQTPSDSQNNPDANNDKNPTDSGHTKDDAGQDNDQAPSGDKTKVEPVITFLGRRNNAVEVRSYVAEVYENGGSCKVTFTMGSQKIERNVEGIKDATYTRCDRVVVPIEEFDSGTWKVVVAYNSPKAEGTSPTEEITIP